MDDESSSADQLRTAILNEQTHLLDAAMVKFRHCVYQLSYDQLWWRPASGLNSIANLMLHVCGNMTQWIICGVGGSEDTRDRQAEFDAVDGRTRDELWSMLEQCVNDVRNVIHAAKPENLLTIRDVQGFDVTGLGAIVHSVTHFVGHTHQVIQLTRLQLGENYVFEWSPDGGHKTLPI